MGDGKWSEMKKALREASSRGYTPSGAKGLLDSMDIGWNPEFCIEKCKTKPPGKMVRRASILGAEEEGCEESNDASL